jgi:hypothetical protein
MKYLIPILLVVPLLGSGCNNSCQQICTTMKKYAKDCGLNVDASEVSECVSRQAGKASRNDRAACRAFGDIDSIQEEWTCEDVAEYWGGGLSEDDDIED